MAGRDTLGADLPVGALIGARPPLPAHVAGRPGTERAGTQRAGLKRACVKHAGMKCAGTAPD